MTFVMGGISRGGSLHSTLNTLCHSLLACTVSAERSAVKRMGLPCMLLVASPLLLLVFFLCV